MLFSELSPKNISSSINIHTLSVQAIGASDLGQEGLPYPLRTGVPIHLIGISEYKNRFVRRAYYCAGRIRAITCACKLDANHQHIFDFVQRRDALLLVRVREEIRWLFSRTSAASSASKRLVGPTVRRLHLLAPSPLACQLTRRRCHLRWAPGPSVRVSPRKGTAAAVSSPRHGAQITRTWREQARRALDAREACERQAGATHGRGLMHSRAQQLRKHRTYPIGAGRCFSREAHQGIVESVRQDERCLSARL